MISIHDSWDAIKGAGVDIAIVPIGSVQQHGPHLPVETDGIILDAVAAGVGNRHPQEVYVLPAIPAGTPFQHLEFGGTICLRAETLLHVAKDVAWSMRQHGISKIVFLNNVGVIAGVTAAPDDNMVVKQACRDLNHTDPLGDYIWCQPATLARDALREYFPDWRNDRNGGDFETSCIKHLAPELVGDAPVDSVPAIDLLLVQAVPFRTIAPTGVWGYPSRATAEKGRLAVEAMIAATLRYMNETFQHLARIKDRTRRVTDTHH